MQNNSQAFITLSPHQVSPALRTMFAASDPASVRCFAVLDGHAAGVIFTDNPESPSWAVLQEAAFGSLYLAGTIQPALMSQMVKWLQLEADVMLGLWPDDPRWNLLPSTHDYSGYTLEFTHRVDDHPLPAVPDGCKLIQLDRTLFKQILDRSLLIRMYGSVDQALEWGYGLCLLRDDELLCESFAGPAANGIIELGVETNPHHLHKGYATITCVHLIQQVESLGYLTYWNCAEQNEASIALARKLGYRTEKKYHLRAWSKHHPKSAGL